MKSANRIILGDGEEVVFNLFVKRQMLKLKCQTAYIQRESVRIRCSFTMEALEGQYD